MKSANLILTLTSVISFTCTHAKIGYFWHVTDFHYDPFYSAQGDSRRHCWKADERGSSGHHRSLGRFGDYACDSSIELIESAAKQMRTRHPDNVEFILWTGDIISAQYTASGRGDTYQAIRNVTELLGRTFSSHFVFPVLGHLDPPPSENLTNLWSHWLPLEALQTFKHGGYYTIEQSHSKLRIVALNTNLFVLRDSGNIHVKWQWEWLEAVLEKAAANEEMVYIVGHSIPGSDYRHSNEAQSPDAKYLRTIRRYSRIIAGQFFGHVHADTFRVIYDNDHPVSWALLAPSVTPHRSPTGESNPGLRLYKFDTNTGKVLDYTQYYLDLDAANRAGVADWTAEYNLTQYYGLHEVSAASLHNLADKLRIGTQQETMIFNKYIRAYSVKRESGESCDGACARQHYCAITSLENEVYRQCVEAAASALAAAGKSAPLIAPLINRLLVLVIFITAMI